jgi:hypothetical protein
MSIIKQKIRFNPSLVGTTGTTGTTLTGNSMNLMISLGSAINFIEYGEEIDNLTQFTALDLVNPVLDGEERRFKLNPLPNNTITLQFQFYSVPLSIYLSSFLATGFTADEISGATNFNNSFFILDFYDTYDINSQTKIFTTYLTKKGTVPIYTIGAAVSNQLYRWYIPLSYINVQTGSTVTGYIKFSFYNSKTGMVTPFINADNISISTPERIFFKTQLDLVNKTWKILTASYPNILIKELVNNTLYSDKVNNTVASMNNLQQNPPNGNTLIISNDIAKYGSNSPSTTTTTTAAPTTTTTTTAAPTTTTTSTTTTTTTTSTTTTTTTAAPTYYKLADYSTSADVPYYTSSIDVVPAHSLAVPNKVQSGGGTFYRITGSQSTPYTGKTLIQVTWISNT